MLCWEHDLARREQLERRPPTAEEILGLWAHAACYRRDLDLVAVDGTGALMVEGMRRSLALGARSLEVGTGDAAPAHALYRSLAPHEVWRGGFWLSGSCRAE